ncbi:hypothetical protein BGZ98_003202 [Dissophora globulifera]|nr:hypothetical protein BGZ98_003202 [Dissophora globulifera]
MRENPLHIPEIRSRISHLVSVNDAIACVRVSKAWNEDFAHPIWCTVDFDTHITFEDLNVKTVIKYGHHINTIKNLTMQSQLQLLLHPCVKNVRYLQMDCPNNGRFKAQYSDLISNNSQSLQTLRIKMSNIARHSDPSNRMISVHAIVPDFSDSRLTLISFSGVCLSRNAFVYLLKRCPLLTHVDLQCDVVLYSAPTIDSFRHPGVLTLAAPIKQVFMPDSLTDIPPIGLTLLMHFPNLVKWQCTNQLTALSVPFGRIKAEITMCCPKVSAIDTGMTPCPALYSLLTDVFHNLNCVTIGYEQLSMDVIVALLFHQATLQEVSTTSESPRLGIEQDAVCRLGDSFRDQGRALQLLPRGCANLTVLKLERHEMDMDYVEEKEWACKGLQQLRVRIKGLDTKQKVDTAIRL